MIVSRPLLFNKFMTYCFELYHYRDESKMKEKLNLLNLSGQGQLDRKNRTAVPPAFRFNISTVNTGNSQGNT